MTEQTTEQFPCPPAPRTEVERLAQQVAELQDLLAQAERDAARALHERDVMRERVSEPNGCTHCGTPQRFHGRRYVIGVGMHGWERPTDEQVKTRMLARRAARQPLETERPAHGKLWSLLDWSFWGAGMGDVFRMPLADAMLAAVPAETIAQAEQIMAEFIERRQIEKTGVTVYQEQRDELEHLRKERDGFRDQRNAVFQTNQRLIGEVEAAGQARLHAENQTRTVTRAAEELRARVAELEAERTKYVGAEPTIAEEMAYLSRCLDAVYKLCEEAKRSGSLGITPEAVEQAADGEWTAKTPRSALPWAHSMDDSDLQMFLDDLVGAAMGRWRSDPDLSARQVLADVEKACADWRTPGQGLRSDEPGTGEVR